MVCNLDDDTLSDIGEACQKRVFHTLDAFRGIAALAVVAFHYPLLFHPLLARNGYLAVDLFFIMSGAVLENAYAARFAKGLNVREFLRIRLVRFYPLYALGLLVGLITAMISIATNNADDWRPAPLAASAALGLLFLPGHPPGDLTSLFPLNSPAWSLFFELLVNIGFALTCRVLTVRRLIIASLILAPLLVWASFNSASNLDLGSEWTAADLSIGFVRAIFGFAVGVAIVKARSVPRFRRSLEGFLILIAAVALALLVPTSAIDRAIWGAFCVLALFPALVYGAIYIEPPRILASWTTILGLSSYAIYILHTPIAEFVATTASFFGYAIHEIGAPYAGVALAVMLVVGGWTIHWRYDVPMRRNLTRFCRGNVPCRYQ